MDIKLNNSNQFLSSNNNIKKNAGIINNSTNFISDNILKSNNINLKEKNKSDFQIGNKSKKLSGENFFKKIVIILKYLLDSTIIVI